MLDAAVALTSEVPTHGYIVNGGAFKYNEVVLAFSGTRFIRSFMKVANLKVIMKSAGRRYTDIMIQVCMIKGSEAVPLAIKTCGEGK
jgi:hypothetical protein